MRRKALQDVANALGPMLIARCTPADLDVISEMPDGTLDVDVLNGTASHAVAGPLRLDAAVSISNWLRSRLEDLSLSVASIERAGIRADYRTDRIPTNRAKIVSFDWSSEGIVQTDEAEYRSPRMERHVFHAKSPQN